MLTELDEAIQAVTSLIHPDRLRATQHALTAMAKDARAAAAELENDSYAGAALRGKAKAYDEARIMLGTLLRGGALHPRSYSSARARQREWNMRRLEKNRG
jgi:hypothetical protein